MIAPNIAMPNTIASALVVENTELLNRSIGRIGSLARRSIRMNRTASSSPPPSRERLGADSQPWSGPAHAV